MGPLIGFFLWGVFWAFCCGALAGRRNRDEPAWAVLGFLFGPLALIALACLGEEPQKAKTRTSKVKRYPQARRIIDAEQDRWRQAEAEVKAEETTAALDAELEARLGPPRGGTTGNGGQSLRSSRETE
jgi:hypothetical protein